MEGEAFGFGLFLGILLTIFVGFETRNSVRRAAIGSGVAEYYISTNNISKEFRWKVCE